MQTRQCRKCDHVFGPLEGGIEVIRRYSNRGRKHLLFWLCEKCWKESGEAWIS